MLTELSKQLQDLEMTWVHAVSQMPTAQSLLAGSDDMPTVDTASFYAGEQWPGPVFHARLAQGRMCLVVNRLSVLVAAALDANRRERLPDLEAREMARLQAIVTRQYRDLQQLYNYLVTAVCEGVVAGPLPSDLLIASAKGVL